MGPGQNARDMRRTVLWVLLVFVLLYNLPVGRSRFDTAVLEGLRLVRWYTRQYLLLTLVPAFLIAGAMVAFVRREAVVRYLGAGARKTVSYLVAAVSGSVLAVCSCAVLPLFSGICRLGAGIGPATTFLYAGPAVSILAVVLTARLLGARLGVARAVTAVLFSVVIGLLMHLIFGRAERKDGPAVLPKAASAAKRSLAQVLVFFVAMIGVMVFANWARSGDIRAVLLCCPGGLTSFEVEGQLVEQSAGQVVILDTEGQEYVVTPAEIKAMQTVDSGGVQQAVYRVRWALVALLGLALLLMLWRWFERREIGEWLAGAWKFATQMLPPLFVGVLAAGFLLGGENRPGLIPRPYVEMLVGNSPEPLLAVTGWQGRAAWLIRGLWAVWSNFFAALVGVFMYFATLTEVPIVRGLMRAGMGQGPALALLLAGPAISLPNMLVIRSIMGTRKTLVYVGLVVLVATLSGILYGLVGG